MSTLSDVVVELKAQNESLTSVRELLMSEKKARQIALRQSESDRKQALEDKRESRAREAATPPTTFKGGVISGLKDVTGFGSGGIFETLRGFLGPLTAGVFGGLFGASAIKGLIPKIGKMVGRGLIFGPAILLLETFGEEIITGLLTEIGNIGPEALKLSDPAKQAIASSIVEALNTGLLLGIFFGKKGFKAGIIGSFIKQGIQYLTGLDESFWEGSFNFAGMETGFTKDTMLGAASLMAAFFGPSLLTGALTQAFTGKAYPGAKVGRNAKGQFTKLSPANAATFRNSFAARLGMAGILLTVGSMMGDYIGQEFGEEAGNVAEWGTYGASAGFLMGGPMGALVGGLVGLAAAGMFALGDYLKDKNDKIVKRAEEELDQSLKSAGIVGEDGTVDVDKLQSASQEVREDIAKNALKVRAEKARAAQLAGADPTVAAEAEEAMTLATLAIQNTAQQSMRLGAVALDANNFEQAVIHARDALVANNKEISGSNIKNMLADMAAQRIAGGLSVNEKFGLIGRRERAGDIHDESKLNSILSARPSIPSITPFVDPIMRMAMTPVEIGGNTNIGQIGDNPVTNTSPMVLNNGVTFDPNDLILAH